jgi:hypothetical protein
MKTKQLTIPVILVFALSFFAASDLMAQKKKKKAEEEAPVMIIIPQPVKAVFESGIQTREPRSDIPFEIVDHLYLPTRENIHNTFILKIKNSDLGFMPLPPKPEEVPAGEEAPAEETLEEPKDETSALYASGHFFLQINGVSGGAAGELVKEVYVPFEFQLESADYDPDGEEYYTVGYPLFPGDYLVSLAVTSPTLDKIGTQYLEVSLPDMAAFTDTMETTPIIFTKSMDRMTSPETQAELHRGCMTYSVLKIIPSFTKEFSPGETLEAMFFIFGTQPDAEGRYQIEVKFSIMKGEEAIIRYAPGNYENPFISQPLPLKRTVIIRTTKGEETTEKQEIQNIDPGDYSLVVEITDKTSEKALQQKVDFTVFEKE